MMPSYIANPIGPQVSALQPGRAIALVNNAAVDANVTKTLQLALGATPGSPEESITIVNSTDKDATGQFAANDADANYKNASGMVVASGTSLAYNIARGWVRFTFAAAPTTGSLIVTR